MILLGSIVARILADASVEKLIFALIDIVCLIDGVWTSM
jgi:hypothetical protein